MNQYIIDGNKLKIKSKYELITAYGLQTRIWGSDNHSYGCAECCNGDRCDEDCDAVYKGRRKECPHCKGKGWIPKTDVTAVEWPEFSIDPDDWVGVKEVKEGEFELQHQFERTFKLPSIHGGRTVTSWANCSQESYSAYHESMRRIIARPKREEQKVDKPDCSQHPKDLFGKTDMKEVAEAIGNLNYETLSELLSHLEAKIMVDYAIDNEAGRNELAMCLWDASIDLGCAAGYIKKAWSISKPYMNPYPAN